MIQVRGISFMLCAAVLTACATTAPPPAASPANMPSILGEADAAVRAGRTDQAYALLKTAAVSHPADKSPLLRMAQLRFDEKNYGEAIVSGLQALERDPSDMLATSLVAVSGLRVSSKALAELSTKNGFTGAVRGEAQELVAQLRGPLNQPVLAGAATEKGPTRAATRNASGNAGAATPTRAATPATAKNSCSGPFCALNP